MGVYLSTPNTEKHSEDGEKNELSFGACAMQVRCERSQRPPGNSARRCSAGPRKRLADGGYRARDPLPSRGQ
eukprot:scaffold340_cov256-Pinguiococcus_pyrenoidosus.AAC.32